MMYHSYPALTLLFIFLLLSSCEQGGGGSDSGTNPPTTTQPGTADSAEPETPIDGKPDPLTSYAWHLGNTGQKSFSTGSGKSGEDISVASVHAAGITGAGVKIAVSDSGVDVSNSDLTKNQIPNAHRDYSSDDPSSWRDGDPYPIEEEGHGTAVTGLSSAIANNGIGAKGIAPGSKFAGFLYIGGFHNSSSSYEAKTLDQTTGDFDVFNYSYGYAGCMFVPASSTLINAYKAGVTNLRGGKGAIYVKAAGNDYIGSNGDCSYTDKSNFLGNTNTSEDQNIPYIIIAAAMNASGKISSYSTPGSGVWVAALGGEYGDDSPAMVTTDIRGCSKGLGSFSYYVNAFNVGENSLNKNCDYTSIMNGTSSAAPVLSGAVALILEANPNLSWRDVKHILAVTADKVNYSTSALTHPLKKSLSGFVYDYVYVKNAAGYSFSNTYGFGRVNAAKAVAMAKTYSSSFGEYKEETISSAALSIPIPDKSATGASHSLAFPSDTTIESVQVKLSTNHAFIGDLSVLLTSPAGTTSRILLLNSNIDQSGLIDFTLLTNAFYGEKAKGNWTIKIVDGTKGDTGSLTKWQLKVNGH